MTAVSSSTITRAKREADGPHSVILNQVTNGVAVRMAVLYLLAGGAPDTAEAAKQGGQG